ncbi:MAG: hypothetical protein H6815_04370 [Phycisphaeraceae bacterium]|nr:hypothetical protein [Phycisphaerales bacterium]MCB9859667.1 hypothetical protein [Phycisphaeraceae bacterium]
MPQYQSKKKAHPALLIGAVGLAVSACAGTSHAQTAWGSAIDGSWLDTARWTAGVPGATTPATLGLAGTYTTTLQNGSGSYGSLQITNPSAVLSVFNNAKLVANGTTTNNGLIQISGPGAPGNITGFEAGAANVDLMGTGVLRLAHPTNGNSDAAYLYYSGAATNTLTNASTHTIAGSGRVYTALINNGTVNADTGAGTTLFMIEQPKTNNGLMTASNGGVLQVNGIALTQSSGGVSASSDDSHVQFLNATVSGGTIDGAGTNGSVQYLGTDLLDGVTLTNLNNVVNNSLVNIGANGVVNNGLWTVSDPSAAGNFTRIATSAANAIVSGTGTIRLQGTGTGNNDSGYLTYTGSASNVLTNGASHSIRGYGRVYSNLVNNGTVNADVAGKTMYMIDQPKTNNGTMTASNGGTLQFSGITVTGNPTAQIISTDASSPVQMVNATMTGGGFTTSGTGEFQYFGTDTLSNLTVNGTHSITNNTLVNLATNLVNNGNWFISAPTAAGNFTRLSAAAPNVTISGTGSIRLQGVASGNGDNDSAYLTYSTNTNQMTLGPNQDLLGYGRVYTNLVNNGEVIADVSGKGIFMIDQPKTNNGTMTASNGGFLQFRNTTVTGNPSAQIISTDSASPVHMADVTMTGGGFTTSGTGLFRYTGTSTLNNLTVNGRHEIANNSTVNIGTDLVNNGDWFISAPTAAGNFTGLNAGDASITMSGTGTIRLQGVQSGNGDNDSAYLYYTNAANQMTLGANQQLRGYGRVYTNLVNNGTINADNTPNASGPASKGMFLIEQPKTNNATITSSNGGFWYIRDCTITNNGLMTSANTATPGGGFQSCTINGGTLSNIAGQYFGTNGAVNLNGVNITPNSGVQVTNNSLVSTTGMTNNGELAVNTVGAPGNFTRIRVTADMGTIDGTGTVRLNSVNNLAINDSAYLESVDPANVTGVLGANQTLAGIGRVYHKWVARGTITPGQTSTGSGEIQCISGSLTFAPTTNYIVHANDTPASGNFDRLTGSSSKAVDGTLTFSFENGYTPAGNERYDVITSGAGGISGTFDTLNLEQISPTGPVHVVYTGEKVSVVACYADCDGSGTLNIFDYICFGNAYSSGDPYANCDSNGSLNIFDYICFGNKFAAGCP